MKNKKRWQAAFILTALTAILGLFWKPTPINTPPIGFLSSDSINQADTAWILTACCLVLLMTPGLSFFYGGMVGKKSIISTMLQSFVCLGVISLIWIVVGFSLAFGESAITINIGEHEYGIIGNLTEFAFFDKVSIYPSETLATSIPFVLFAVFQMKFAVITPAIITGSFAERVRFIAYLFFISLFTIIIYTPLCHMVWHPNGILGGYFGIKDFAGGTVVHMSAGFAALAGALYIGKRNHTTHTPTNIPFILLGTGMLWFGWFGFNAGSALAADGNAAIAMVTTTAASAMAMMTWIVWDKLNGRKANAMGASIGAVVGLVAITPAAGFVSIPESIFFGFIGALISNIAMHWNRLKAIDDTLDVFACHGLGGITGMVLTAIFAHGENASLLHGGWDVFSHHMIALVLVSIFTFFGAFGLYAFIDKLVPLRVSKESEEQGLDITQHQEYYQ